jgi:hypothetical protein
VSMRESAEVMYWHHLLERRIREQDRHIPAHASYPEHGDDFINGAFMLRLVPISFYDFSVEMLDAEELPTVASHEASV